MRGLNFRARGFASALALAVATWLGLLAMTQLELNLIPLKMQGFYHQGLRKDQILNQTLPTVLAMDAQGDEQGQLALDGHLLDWTLETKALGTLSATLARFEEQSEAGWPEGVGLRVIGRDGQWLLVDYR